MKRTKRGFTMAEMLITIGIIAILMAFASIPIMGYLRSLHQVEMDAIAKEIFVAAQNHLTMADSQNLTAGAEVQGAEDGTEKGVRYFVVSGEADSPYPGMGEKSSVLDYMLPVASIDDTVRLKGSYVIRYSPSQAKILDVFYASTTGRFSHTFSAGEYSDLKELKDKDTPTVDNRSARRNCLGGAAIGWYGGEKANELKKGTKLQTPTVEVINAERLLARVSYKHTPNASVDNDDKINLTLTVTGEQSTHHKTFTLIKNGEVQAPNQKKGETTYEIVLDDVTKVVYDNANDSKKLWDSDKADDKSKQKSNHFADVFYVESGSLTETPLIPGENITVQAELTNNYVLTNVAESSKVKTNSLFADMEIGTGNIGTAKISNIRHLENLDESISGLDKTKLNAAPGKKVVLQNATQTAELDWDQFMAAILDVPAGKSGDYDAAYGTEATPVNKGTESKPDEKKGVRICTYAAPSETAKESATNCFMPVDMENMTYNPVDMDSIPACHTIANIKTDVTDGPAGVFGTLTDCSLNWVTVYNSVSAEEEKLMIKSNGVATDGSKAAGGLVGKMTGGTVSHCGAAVYVKSDSDAGGLIGYADGVDVNHSYAGGHTKDGKYLAQDTGVARWNVNGATAGGLIGAVNNGKVKFSYATTSVYGTTMAGGFAGSIDAVKDDKGNAVINGNYCTGLVYKGTKTNPGKFGAYAGEVNEGEVNSLDIFGDADITEGAFDETKNYKNYYYDAVNYDGTQNKGMFPIREIKGETEAIKQQNKKNYDAFGRIDENLTTMNKFYPIYAEAEQRCTAVAYDETLDTYYNALYPLWDLTGIRTHYGDWPMVETFVINK